MKKFMIVLTAAILAFTAAFGFAGCTRNDDQSEYIDPEAIVLLGKSTDMEKTYMKKIFARYKETGKKIYVKEVKDADFEKTARDIFARGEGPDILFHFHNDDLNRIGIDNFVTFNDAEWADDLTDSAKRYCTDAEGNLLGLPFWENSVSGCYYNKKLFDQRGLRRAHDQSEFDVLCTNIKQNLQGVIPICWPANGCSWMYQFGLDPVFADNQSRLDRLNADEIAYADITQVKNMADWIKKAKDSGWFGDKKSDYLNTGWDDMSAMLNSGKAAMIFIWDTWFYTDFVEGTYKKEDFALMPVFMNTTAGEGTYEGGNLNMMMVNVNSEKKQDAIDFLSFCADPENYNYAFDGVPTLNCFKGQTTNIQSAMVNNKEIQESLAQKERVSTASTKIAGYSADDVAKIFRDLLDGKITVSECIARLDENRLSEKASLTALRMLKNNTAE